MALDDLIATFELLEARAQADPRLERYRVGPAGTAALEAIPEGWFLSEAMAHLLVHGGWSPGDVGWHGELGRHAMLFM